MCTYFSMKKCICMYFISLKEKKVIDSKLENIVHMDSSYIPYSLCELFKELIT